MRSDADLTYQEILSGLRSIDYEAVKNNRFLADFIPSIIKQILGGRQLSPRQVQIVVDTIRKNAPKATLKDLDLYELPQERPSVSSGSAPAVSSDELIIAACQNIRPYFAGDKTWFTGFAQSIASRRSLSDRQRAVCAKYLNNYQDQLDKRTRAILSNKYERQLNLIDAAMSDDTSATYYLTYARKDLENGKLLRQEDLQYLSLFQVDKNNLKEVVNSFSGVENLTLLIQRRPSFAVVLETFNFHAGNTPSVIGNKDPFYHEYTLDYIKFLVEAARYAITRSVMRSDVHLDMFIRTRGIGPDDEKTERWEKHVEKVHDKLKKVCDKLPEICRYIRNPEEFAANPQAALDIVTSAEYTEAVTFTEDQKLAVLEAMQNLSAVCDYAHQEDFQGFNKTDASTGHAYAAQDGISDDQMPRALAMCRFYRKQLPHSLLKRIGIIESAPPKPKREDLRELACTMSAQSVAARYLRLVSL